MATIAPVQSKTQGGTGTTPTLTLTGAPTAGNLLVAFVNSAAATAITENSGTWTAGTSVTGGSGATARASRLFWKIAGAGESSSPAFTSASGTWGLHVLEYSSSTGWQATPKDIENAQVNASGTTNTPSVTPTGAQQELAVFALALRAGTSTTWSAEALSGSNAGVITEETDASAITVCDSVVSTTSGAYQGSGTASAAATGTGAIAFFKPSTTPVTLPPGLGPFVGLDQPSLSVGALLSY